MAVQLTHIFHNGYYGYVKINCNIIIIINTPLVMANTLLLLEIPTG